MTTSPTTTDTPVEAPQDAAAPACVMSFNASDPSGAGGLAGDIATISAMGAHALPIVTAVVLRDTAEVFSHTPLDADTVVEQARSILEDVTIAAWKVGFLGSAEGVSAVAEVLSDYPDVPLVAYMPNLSWLEEDDQQALAAARAVCSRCPVRLPCRAYAEAVARFDLADYEILGAKVAEPAE